ncbi:MAG: TonB-dependent receptor [Planctomycetes bacterium]|nr:TonB-dependent receptor [Planctomycetota bacterium]
MNRWLVWMFGAWLCLGGVARAQEEKAKPVDPKKAEKQTPSEENGGEAKKKKDKKEGEKDKNKSADEDAEEIVVTATRTLRKLREIGKAMTVVTAKQIADKHPNTMTEVLRGLPGVRLVNQGGVGGIRTLSIRGANSDHTLLLINGVPLVDPTSVDSDINSFLGDINPDDIERIEILRGAQSTLYGSDAIGGVVNIILKEGKRKPTIGATWEGGSQSTSKETVNAGGSFDLPVLDRVAVHFTGTRIDSNGIPALEDKYENTSATINGRLFVTPELSFGAVYRLLNVHQHYDDFDSFTHWPPQPVRDSNQWRSLDQDFMAYDVKHELDDWMDYKLVYSESKTSRLLHDNLNPTEDLGFYYWQQGTFLGRTQNFNAQTNIHPFGDLLTLSLGYEYERHSMRSTQTQWTGDPPWFWPPIWQFDRTGARLHDKALYMEAQVQLWERVFVTGGVRKDQHSTWGSHNTGELSAAIILPYTETKLKGNWGLGFKAPSLYQLFDPIVGTPALSPEDSESWDIGFEQPLFNEKASVDLSYFENKFYNLIGWAFTNDPARIFGGEFQNLGNAKTEGIELAVKVKPWSQLEVRTYYTYIHSVVGAGSVDRGKPMLNVPSDTIGIDMTYKPTKKLTVALDLNFTGSSVWQYQSSVPSNTAWGGASVGPHTGGLYNPAFWKADLSVTYKVNDWLKIWGRCENMLDQKYQNFGIPAARISAYGGLGVQF